MTRKENPTQSPSRSSETQLGKSFNVVIILFAPYLSPTLILLYPNQFKLIMTIWLLLRGGRRRWLPGKMAKRLALSAIDGIIYWITGNSSLWVELPDCDVFISWIKCWVNTRRPLNCVGTSRGAKAERTKFDNLRPGISFTTRVMTHLVPTSSSLRTSFSQPTHGPAGGGWQ